MKYSGIIFDLDGTIIDTVFDLHDALNTTLRANHFPLVTLEQTRDYIGNGLFKLIQRAVPKAYKTDKQFIEKLLSEFKANYREKLLNKTKPYPGILELFEYCNRNNILIGVASNKSDAESKLLIKTLFPDATFVKVIGHREGHPHKPDKEIINEILSEMKLSSNQVLYIGDSITDYQTANNAELDCVLVTYGYEKKDVLEKLKDVPQISDSEDLLKLVLNLEID